MAAAEKRSRSLKMFYSETKLYHHTKPEAEHHKTLLLSWILAQVPLIEAEMAKSSGTNTTARGKSESLSMGQIKE